MLNLEDLFDASDYKKSEKGGKNKSAQKDGKKKAEKKDEKGKDGKEKKGIRYPLPVRVRAGHVCCDLLKSEYEGKTVSETDIKNKIRQCYPELSGIQMNLVKFENKFTQMLESREKLKVVGAGSEPEEKVSGEDSEKDKDALEFAPAEDEEIPEDMEEESAEEMEDAEESDGDGMEQDEDPADNSSGEEIFVKGCWVKLEIHYQELAENQEVTYPVSVVAGNVCMKFGSETGSMEEVREKWTAAHPEYEGCLFHYDDKQDMLVPFVRGENEVKGKKYKLPLTVGYLDLTEHYDKEDFGGAEEGVTLNQVRELYAKKHPEYENAIFACVGEGKHLFPVLSFKKEGTSDRYALPIVVRGPGFRLDLDSSDFKEKESVTLEEIRSVIEGVYPEFSKERTEMVYDERGFVVPILRGSRKGILVTSERVGQDLIFTTGRDGRTYRIEQMPYGYFDCSVDGEEVDFRLCSGKIPEKFLVEIIAFFRRNPKKEAAVQVFYDAEKKEYGLYYPPQQAGACCVVFDRNPELENNRVLMMDVHSHAGMRAFFSSVDDHDERGTRLFMVIGRLDKTPECRLRAGIAGFYKDIPVAEVFELEEKKDEI